MDLDEMLTTWADRGTVRGPDQTLPPPARRRTHRTIQILALVAFVAVLASAAVLGARGVRHGSTSSTAEGPDHPVVGSSVQDLRPGMIWESNGMTFGTMPDMPAGPATESPQTPMFIAVTTTDGVHVAGYVRSDALEGQSEPTLAGPPNVVVGDDGVTAVGIMANGRGFVALEPDQGLLAGRLTAEGGPSGQAPFVSLDGTITFIAADGQRTVAAATQSQGWLLALPPGTYTVEGASPQIDDGRIVCRPEAPTISVEAGSVISANVICQIK